MKFRLTAKEPGTALELLKTLEVPADRLRRQLKLREVKVNGARISADCPVRPGDTVEIFVPEAFVRAAAPQVVFEADGLIVADKPAGLDTFRAAEQLGAYPAHRLDRNTSGLMLFARSQEAKAAAERAFAGHKIDKYYYALVTGEVAAGGTAVTYMGKDAAAAYVRVSDTPKAGYVRAVTEYEPTERGMAGDGVYTVVRVKLVTGRTHQIRAFFAHIGHPLAGDGKYGGGRGGQRLVAYRLVIGDAGLKSADGRTFELPPDECRRRLGLDKSE